MASIGTLAVNIVARTDKFLRGITQSQKGIVKFGKSLLALGKKMAMFTAAATAAGAAALTYLVKNQFAAVDALAKTADKLGITTERLAGLQLAASEGGVATEALAKSLQMMERNISDASQGTGEAMAAFKMLGIDVKALRNLEPDQQFRVIAEAMNRVGNQSDKVSIAMDIFGRSGADMLNVMKGGAGVLDEAQSAAERLGLTVSRDMAAAVERANDAFGRFKSAIVGLARQIAVRLAPVMEMASKAMEGFLTDDGRIHKIANAIAAGIGGAIAGVLSAVHKFRIELAKINEMFRELMLDVAKSPLAKLYGIDFSPDQVMQMGRDSQSAFFNRQTLEREADPGKEFMAWFNRHLDQAFTTTTPEAKKTEDIIGKWAAENSKIGFEGIGKLLGMGSNKAAGAVAGAAKAFGGIVGGGGGEGSSSLTLARSGSAESYRQRRAIEKQNNPLVKVAKQNAKDNKRAADGIQKIIESGLALIPANLTGG